VARTMLSASLPATESHAAPFSVPAKLSALVRSLHLDDPLLVALMAIAFVLRLVFWAYTRRIWEDALITLLHSENFYHGLGITHFKVDDPKPLHGFTSPLSLLVPLIADGIHLGWGSPFQKLLSLIAGPVAVWFGYRIVRDYLASSSLAAAVLAAGYLAIEHHQILWGMAGMETQLAIALLLASIYFLLSGNTKGCAITSGLCLLARPDFILWVAIAFAAFVYASYLGKELKPLLLFIGIVTVTYAPWLVFTTLYYGSPIPNTVIAKRLGYPGFWEVAPSLRSLIVSSVQVFGSLCEPLEPVFGGNGTGFIPLVPGRWLGGFWMAMLCVTVIAVGLIAEVVRRRWRFWPVYSFAALFASFLVFAAPIRYEWYLAPLCAVLALLLGKGLADITSLLPVKSGAPIAWLLAVTYLASFAVVLPTTFRAERNIQQIIEDKVRIAIGIYLSQKPFGTTIAGEPLGYIGYYSRQTYYDYPGLCSRKVVRWLQAHKYPRRINMIRVFAYLKPDYIVLRKKEYDDFVTHADGAFLEKEYHLEREFAVSEKDGIKLFHPERNADLAFLLFARSSKLPRN